MAAFTLRPARLPEDVPAIAAIDGSFESEAAWLVRREGEAFRLSCEPRPRFSKRFWVYDLTREDREWDEADVAEAGGAVQGFAASSYQFWNRRFVLWHLYVAPAWRSSGMGSALLEAVIARARAHEAVSLWLETSSLNAPGIAWYRKRGFDFAGFDAALYHGTGDADEVGLYLMKRLGG